jgi:hypothetical protein
MLDKTTLVAGAYAIGPLAVLNALILSLLSSSIWSRNVGETSCAWRVTYSPDGRTFSIWLILYLGTVWSVVTQLTNQVPVFDWLVQLLWGIAWGCCALWTPLFDAESPGALRAAAFLLVTAAACATAAVALADYWVIDEHAPERQRSDQTTLGWPLSAFAGWLAVAAAINIGVAHKAANSDASACVRVEPRRRDETERDYRRRRRVLYREAYAKSSIRISLVPVVLAVGVGGLAAFLRDPIYPLPLMWALLNLAGFPSCEYLMALVLCGCGIAGAVVRIL